MTREFADSKKYPSNNRRDGLCPKNCMIGLLISVALSSLVTFVIFWCTDIFRDSILSNLEIKNGSSMFDRWQRSPVRPAFRVRIFNYTNINDFQSGRAKKLKIVEVGPYEYRETLTRVNPAMNDDGTVTYQEKRSFQWEGGNPDDEIVTVPNVPLFSAMAFTRDMNFVAQVGLTAILTTIRSKTFIDVPAGGFIWGYDDKIFEMAKSLISWQKDIPIDKFGILALKNGVSPDRITIKTGKNDITEVGRFEKLNGQSIRDIWGDERCDKIDGTDGTIFSSKLLQDHNSTLKIYARDMCRSLTLKYQGRGIVRGVPTLTYKPPLDTFTSTATKDSCYCARNPNDLTGHPISCPPVGTFNNSVCSYGLPLLTSFPHFYAADKKLGNLFDGLNPQAEKHESLIEIHPRLGVPIGGYSRVQMNLEVRKALGVPFLGRLKDGTILPLLWIEIEIDNMPESLQNLFYHAYFTAASVEAGMQWISLVGIVFCVCTTMCLLKRRHTDRHRGLKRNVSGQNPLIG